MGTILRLSALEYRQHCKRAFRFSLVSSAEWSSVTRKKKSFIVFRSRKICVSANGAVSLLKELNKRKIPTKTETLLTTPITYAFQNLPWRNECQQRSVVCSLFLLLQISSFVPPFQQHQETGVAVKTLLAHKSHSRHGKSIRHVSHA